MSDDRNDQIDFLQPETIKALCKKAMTDYDEAAAELTRFRERNAELERERDEAWASAENQLRLANNAAKATSQANARISSLEATVREMREALNRFGKMQSSIKADVSTAHRLRGDAASDWMREDDADMRKDLRRAFDEARAALASSESVVKSEGDKDGVE